MKSHSFTADHHSKCSCATKPAWFAKSARFWTRSSKFGGSNRGVQARRRKINIGSNGMDLSARSSPPAAGLGQGEDPVHANVRIRIRGSCPEAIWMLEQCR